jgi:pimeloyl-ACP methyl ester carboxylesterase
LLIALCVAALLSEQEQELYLDIQIQATKSTEIRVFFDSGRNFRPEESSSRKLAGSEVSRNLRFLLPQNGVKRVRIDFERPADAVIISRISLVDVLRATHQILDLEGLRPNHDIQNIAWLNNEALISASGSDPQLVLSLEDRTRARWTIHPGLVLSLTFLCYPLLWMVIRLFFRTPFGVHYQDSRVRLAHPCPGTFSSPLHQVLLWVGIIFWCAFAANGLLDDHGRRLVKEVENKQNVYRPEHVATEVWLARRDGLRIRAMVYLPSGQAGPYPALLLLHGNYPQGQQYPLYPVLANELAGAGYLVMTIDFAGYGRSDDPFAADSPRDVSLEQETRAALSFLEAHPDVQSECIGVIGHSMGADPALIVGLQADSAATIIAIGPPRRVQERFYSPADLGFFWNWAVQIGQRQYGRDHFPFWYDKTRWANDILARDMVYQLPVLTCFQHKPVLFIDAEREPLADLRYLSSYVRRCTFPKGYATLTKADHDCNVRSQGGQIIYDPGTMAQLVDVIDTWCRETMRGRPDWSDYLRNSLRWLFARNRFVID